MDLHRLVERIGRIEALDDIAAPLTTAVQRAAPPRSLVKDLLSGTWLGHPLHPMLTDIPIGSFTSATVLDLIGGGRSQRAADRLVALGLVSSVVTAAAGAADWSDTHGPAKRTGVVHAAANAVGVLLYATSAVARWRGRRREGTVLGLLGMGAMSVGGHLGGHLAFGGGVGVNHALLEDPPEEWTPVLPLADLADGAVVRADADGAAVLLSRRGDEILAIGARCSHAGGPLADGEVDAEAGTVTCPWHQSEFRLDGGGVVHGPASVPQVGYETRVADGRVEVRARR